MSTTSQKTEYSPRSKIGQLLLTNRIAKAGEIIGLFLVGLLLIQLLLPLAGDNIIVKQAIVWVANLVMLLLVIGNLMQVAIWAQLFVWLNEFEQFNESFYHSAVNFATLGYGDLVMSPAHKLLGPLEAINGVLMIGVSTAAMMSAFQDAIRKTMEARRHD